LKNMEGSPTDGFSKNWPQKKLKISRAQKFLGTVDHLCPLSRLWSNGLPKVSWTEIEKYPSKNPIPHIEHSPFYGPKNRWNFPTKPWFLRGCWILGGRGLH
jgi:hypothetical protein